MKLGRVKLLGDVPQEESSDPSEALNHYDESMALATELAMRPLQAHIHLSLGRLYRRENQIEKARTELSLALDILPQYGDAHVDSAQRSKN